MENILKELNESIYVINEIFKTIPDKKNNINIEDNINKVNIVNNEDNTNKVNIINNEIVNKVNIKSETNNNNNNNNSKKILENSNQTTPNEFLDLQILNSV